MGPQSNTHFASKSSPYSDYDKKLHVTHEFIKGKITEYQIQEDFSFINLDKLTEIIHNKKTCERYLKWYKMSYNEQERKDFSNINLTELSRSVSKSPIVAPHNRSQHSFSLCDAMSPAIRPTRLKTHESSTRTDKDNIDLTAPNGNLDISQCERGLRKYFLMHKDHFIQRVAKGPPCSFRWLSWLILCEIPLFRSSECLYSLMSNSLDPLIDTQIKKDLSRTLKEQEMESTELLDSLYKILKAIALLDQEVSYCQGMNFICGLMLILSEGNEIDTFYLMMALFSNTFTQSLGIRAFFLESFPMLKLYIFAFEILFKKKLPKLFLHFQALQIPNQCWISKWFQTLFVHCLPEDAVFRIWDCIFAYGIQFIISFAVSLLSSLEKILLEADDIVDITNCFQRLNPFFSKYDQSSSSIEINIENLIKNAIKIQMSQEEMEKIKIAFNANENEDNNSSWKKIYNYRTNNFIPQLITEKSTANGRTATKPKTTGYTVTISPKKIVRPKSINISGIILQSLEEGKEEEVIAQVIKNGAPRRLIHQK